MLTFKALSRLLGGRLVRVGDCWEWTGARFKKGYGSIKWKGKYRRAHVVAWELANGQRLPRGKIGCHSCDNPPCCRPEHVWAGTHKLNAEDREAKGRGRRGKGRWQLDVEATTRLADKIRADWLTGASQKVLARRYGASNGFVWMVINDLRFPGELKDVAGKVRRALLLRQLAKHSERRARRGGRRCCYCGFIIRAGARFRGEEAHRIHAACLEVLTERVRKEPAIPSSGRNR